MEAFEFLYNFQLDSNTNGITIFIDKISAIHTVIKGKHSKNSMFYIILINHMREKKISLKYL